MAPVVEKLSHNDMISLAAYIASLKPQAARLSFAASTS
jgi:cytochrome c553